MQTQAQEELKMEWEVETEDAPATEIEVEVETEHVNNNTYNRSVNVVRSYNKHLFTWVFNFMFGMFGLDRFLRGQTGLGLLKLISFGGFGYWYLIDYVIAIVKAYAGSCKDTDEFLFDESGHYIN